MSAKRKRTYSTPSSPAFGQFKKPKTMAPRAPAAASVPRVETKYVDGWRGKLVIKRLSGVASDTWASTNLNPQNGTSPYGCLPIPRQGINYSDRDGRRIFQKKIRIKGLITWNGIQESAVSAQSAVVRIIVVKDTKTNGIEMSGENAIGPGLGSDGTSASSGIDNALQLLSHPDGWGRYQIVHDEEFTAPPRSVWYTGGITTEISAASIKLPFNITVKCNCEVNFKDAIGRIGSVVDNSYHVLAASSAADIITQVSYYARTSFTG